MPCTTIIISQAKPIITGLTVKQTTIWNQVNVFWNLDISGPVTLKLNGSQVGSIISGLAGANSATISNLSVGTNTICVES